MQLGYNTNGLIHHRLDEALELLAAHGYEAVALTLDQGHLDPFSCTPAEVRETAALLRRLGLSCVVETGARHLLDPARKHRPTLLEASEEERAVRIDFLLRSLRIAEELGALALSFWSGARPEGVSPDTADRHLQQGIEELLPHAARHGVPLAFEPEPGMWIETVAQAEMLATRLGNPSEFGFTIDVGHLYVTGEGLPSEVLPRVRDRILQIHVEDIRTGIHEHLPPGEGDVDFPELWRSLASIGYAGPLCWELGRSSHAAPEMLVRAKACFESRQGS